MSMIGNFRRLPEADLNRLLDAPDLITDYLYEDAVDGFGPFADLDTDKAWHGIHFLLNGAAWEGRPPLDFIVAGGTDVGEVDVGYGPARGFTNAQLRAISDALATVGPDALRKRFDPRALKKAEIYPDIWDRRIEEDDTLGYLIEHYVELRDFLRAGADAGEALLVYIN